MKEQLKSPTQLHLDRRGSVSFLHTCEHHSRGVLADDIRCIESVLASRPGDTLTMYFLRVSHFNTLA